MFLKNLFKVFESFFVFNSKKNFGLTFTNLESGEQRRKHGTRESNQQILCHYDEQF